MFGREPGYNRDRNLGFFLPGFCRQRKKHLKWYCGNQKEELKIMERSTSLLSNILRKINMEPANKLCTVIMKRNRGNLSNQLEKIPGRGESQVPSQYIPILITGTLLASSSSLSSSFFGHVTLTSYKVRSIFDNFSPTKRAIVVDTTSGAPLTKNKNKY